MTTMRRKPVRLDRASPGFGEDPSDPLFNIEAARKAHSDVMRRWDDPVEGDDFKGLLLHAIQNATAIEIERATGRRSSASWIPSARPRRTRWPRPA